MTLTLNELTEIYPEQVWLEFSRETDDRIWKASQEYSNNAARWNAYINNLCLSAILAWLPEETEGGEQPQPVPSLEVLKELWEVVNGSAIALGDTRIIVIPTEETDTETFCIPQEWVDLPAWVGDYYLAAIVEPDEGWVRIWGYTNRENLKSKAHYNEFDRVYCLDRDFVTEDLNVMWVGREVCPPGKPEIAPLASLSGDEAVALVETLGRRSPYSPRLEVEFEKWGALLERENLVRMLYQKRLSEARSPRVANLRRWLEGAIEAGWQRIEELISTRQVQMGYRFRGPIAIERGKAIDLGMEVGGQSVALIAIVSPEAETEIDIRLQVYPMDDETYLPPGLKLIIIEESGEEVISTESRELDNAIQLHFTAEFGETFSAVVAFGEVIISQEFCV
ncbi:MAG: DUF1822 family protein [Okeania sp. SIO2H7]|nr:DUF1822 family protein [Okeania sp. SIO2H7]